MRKASYQNGKIGLGGLLILLSGLYLLYRLFLSPRTASQLTPSNSQDQTDQLNGVSSADISPKSVISQGLSQVLDGDNIKYWTAISALETGYWTSPIFVHNLNLFGMRLPSGNTTAYGSADGFALFTSLSDSVQDLVLYFSRLNWHQYNFASLDELVSMMKLKGYFVEPAKEYLAGAKGAYNQLYPNG